MNPLQQKCCKGFFLRSYIYPYLTEFLYVVQERPECSNALEVSALSGRVGVLLAKVKYVYILS